MKNQQSLRLCGLCLSLGLTSYICLTPAFAGELNGTEWKITSGDTLYSIGRSVYPDNAASQAKLRQDITILNPDVFALDEINMQPGMILQLPQYVVDPQATGTVAKPINPTPAASAAPDSSRATWIVEAGDTLYSISRSIFPEDPQKQSVLRLDIVKLNRPVFADGNDNLAIGTALALPRYLDDKAQANAAKAALAPVTAATVATATPAASEAVAKPATVATAVEPATTTTEVAAAETATTTTEVATAAEPAPEPVAEAPETVEPETTSSDEPVNKRRADPETESGENNLLLSIGLAYGGDELVEVDNGLDITGGSGINLRLGYQYLPGHGSGYRVALGLQYHWVEDASLQDTYLQLAYHYRASDFLYGIGVVSHSGAELEDFDFEADFDSSTGVFLYLENVGDGSLGGWGLSLTSLEIESDDVDDDIDASSAEIYYSWNF
jgi:hypothetical protein